MFSIKAGLQQIKNDGESEKLQFLLLLTDEAMDALDNECILNQLPKYKLREIILAPIQVSLESPKTKLNLDALNALEAFVESNVLYDAPEDPMTETDLTFQFLDTISPCTIFSDSIQASFLKLLLKLCLSKYSRLNVNSMLRIVQICTDLYCKYILTRNNEMASVTQATLVKTVEAFFAKNELLLEFEVNELKPRKMGSSVYDFLCCQNSNAFELSNSQLQILGFLKCLLEAIMPENIANQDRMSIPVYLRTISAVISLLPVCMINHRAFLNILWQRMFPVLLWFLSNRKRENSNTVVSDIQSQTKDGVDNQLHGKATSVAPQTLCPEELKFVYDILIDLTYLVGPVRELRPMLESLFHKMLFFLPTNFRLNALTAVCKLFNTTEGLLSIAGPLISMPMLPNSDGCSGSTTISSDPDFRIFCIILEFVHECSLKKDRALVYASAKCVNLLSATLSALIRCESLGETFLRMVESKLETTRIALEDDNDRETSTGNDILDTNLPHTLDVDRWAARDYLLSLMKTVPSLLDAQSVIEVDNLLLEFSSAYCRDRRTSVSNGALIPTEFADFSDESNGYSMCGAPLNADAVYAATISALTLNYRLLQAGFYSHRGKAAAEVMSEAEFLKSVFGEGLMLYVSETWLSQIYREIRRQDLLGTSGLMANPKCENEVFRGACLAKVLVEFDGIGWTYDKATEEICEGDWKKGGVERTVVNAELKTKQVQGRVGEALVSCILSAAWERIVETLTNSIALAGMRVNTVPFIFTKFAFFTARRPSVISWVEKAETSNSSSMRSSSKPFFQNLFDGVEGTGLGQSSRESELSLSESLQSLQQLATLASTSKSEALRIRCGSVFALLTETARAASTISRGVKSPLPPNRLHPAQVLGINVVLSNALRLGCQSHDCWLHLFNACQLVRDLEHAYFTSLRDSDLTDNQLGNIDEKLDLPEIVAKFCAANSNSGECLTVGQTGVVLSALATQVDRIFDTASEALSLPALIDFLYYLLQASSAELAARGHPTTLSSENEVLSNMKHTVTVVKDEIMKVAKRGITSSHGDGIFSGRNASFKSPGPTLFLDRLSQVLLRIVRSPKRPLLHLMHVWVLVSQHLVDACCFSSLSDSVSFKSDAERLLVSQRALACLHDCLVTTVTTRHELPYFNTNETFCKPFELLLRLDMCDRDLQDRVVIAISEVVERCSSALHSGWRPIFGALRSIKVPLLADVDELPLTTTDSVACNLSDSDEAVFSVYPKASTDSKATFMRKISNKRRISAMLEIFEIFLLTDDILVFCNIAVDCVRCLLRYLSAGEVNYTHTDIPTPLKSSNSSLNKHANDRRDQQTMTSGRGRYAVETSCTLCKATLPLLVRCCEIFSYIWGTFAKASTSATTPPSVDYVMRSARRQVHLMTGGPPQLNLIPGVRSFSSPILRERVKNLTSWFSMERFFEPTFFTNPVNPNLYTLRSLDDIDQPSGVLHLWFLTLEGIVMAIWDCNPHVHRVVFEEFTKILEDCVKKIRGEANIPISCITDGIEREEIETKNVAIGPSFVVFVVNHVLLPRLQAAAMSITPSGGVYDPSETDDNFLNNEEDLQKNVYVEEVQEEDDGADECVDERMFISKLSFIIGQTTQLVCNLISQFQRKNQEKFDTVVGMNLMLHQCLHVLVDFLSTQNERLSRLAASCLRHLLLSTATYLTVHQWEIAIAHLEEAFRACLFPVHTLTTVCADRASRSLPSSAGLQFANLRPIGASNKLRQLALKLFQSPEQLNEAPEGPQENNHEGGTENCEKSSYSFEFRVFPLCTHEVDRPPLDVIPLSSIISSILNLILLIHLIGEILLKVDETTEESLPKVVPDLLLFDSQFSLSFFNHNADVSPTLGPRLTTSEFLTSLPLNSGLRLLNCLSDSYTAFFDFNLCDDLKKIIQGLLNFESPANLYQQSNLTATALHIILLHTVKNGLAPNFRTQLSENIKAAFFEFDNNLPKLRVNNFRRLPLQLRGSTTRGEFISPLPWLKPLVPDGGSDRKIEQLTFLLAGLSTHLTQFYLYLMHKERFVECLLADNDHKSSSATVVYPNISVSECKTDSLELNSKDNSLLKNLLGTPLRTTIDVAKAMPLDDLNVRCMKELLTDDRVARMTSLAKSLATLLESFLTLSMQTEAVMTDLPTSFTVLSALEDVFASSIARLIAVAEHTSLRNALAAWFLRLVQNQIS